MWISCGNGVNIANTRPISFACLYDSTNLRTAGAYGTLISQGRVWYGSGTGGWSLLVEAAAAPRLELGWNPAGGGAGSIHSSFTTAPNTGIHLAAGVIYDNGANTRFRFFHYRYSNATFQAQAAAVPTVVTDANVGSSAAGDPFLIGAGWTGAATEDWFPGTILWAACFSHDLGLGGGTTLAALPQMSHLIFQGPWAMLDRCVGFWSFQTGSAIDLSKNATRRNGTLTGAPSYSYAVSKVVTGTPPGGVWRIIRGPAGGGGVTVDLTSVPATAAGTAVNPSVVQASLTLNLTAVIATAVSSAVTPTVRQGSLTINATASPAMAAGTAIDPTVTVSGGGGPIDLTAAPATATSSAVSPTVVQSSVTVNASAAPASATSSAIDPTVRQASLTLNLSAVVATAVGSAVTPTVTLSGGGVTVNLTAVPASATSSAVSPSVRQGSVVVAPEPSIAVSSAITPTVRQASLSVNLATVPALAIGTAVTPTTTVAAAAARATGLASGRRLLWPVTASRVTVASHTSHRVITRPSLTGRGTSRPATSGHPATDPSMSGSEHQ